MTTFDQILPRMVQVLRDVPRLSDLGPLLVNRDLNGRVRLIAGESLRADLRLTETLSALATRLKEELGPHAAPEESFLIFEEDVEAVIGRAPVFSLDGFDTVRVVDRLVTESPWTPIARESNRAPRVVFFSIKGGVGRSTALAVSAWSLAQSGKRVLVLDLDLESPGLSSSLLPEERRPEFGLADWIWLMDDDIEPDTGCLEGLLSFSEISRCLHPRKYFQNGVAHEWEGYYDLRTGQRVFQEDPSFKKGFAFCTTNTGCFEGMLVHRSVVDAIGYPDRRFFIGMDDSLYGFMAHFHTPVLYLRDPFVTKKVDAPKGDTRTSNRSLYYGMRNAFLFKETFDRLVPKDRATRSFYLGVKFVGYALNILQNGDKKLEGFRWLIRGWRDGRKGRFGKGL